MALKEDYLDDILDTSTNEKRKYRMINNSDGTISLEDVTEYSQNGDNFGAFDINITNKTVNELIAMGLNVRCNENGFLEVLVDGVWEQTEIKAITPKTYLYKQGVFNTNLVSGWSTNDYLPDALIQDSAIRTKPTLTLNENTFTLYSYTTETYVGGFGSYSSNDKIDLSKYNTLNINISEFIKGNDYAWARICVITELKDNYSSSSVLARKDIVDNAGTFSLDISSVNESCYIVLSLATGGAPLTVTVSDIWLE